MGGNNLRGRLKATFSFYECPQLKGKAVWLYNLGQTARLTKEINVCEMIYKFYPIVHSFYMESHLLSFKPNSIIQMRHFSENKFQESYWKQVFYLLWVKNDPQMELLSDAIWLFLMKHLRTILKDKCNLLWQNHWLLSQLV